MAGIKLPELNQVLLTGRLTRDPEVLYTQQGTAKCWFSIAVNKNYKDKATGEWKEQVTYVPIVVWREAAERCKEKLRKGSPVHVEGRLASREFEDKKSGGKRKVLEVEARRVQFLSSGDAAPGVKASPDDAEDKAASAAMPPNEADIEEVPF